MEGIIDIHCHILPGIDDGPRSMEQALALLAMEYRQGVRGIIMTPHSRPGYFDTSRRAVERRFSEIQERVGETVPGQMQLYLGCEFFRRSEMTKYFSRDAAYRMASTSYILLEFSRRDGMERIRRDVMDLLIGGFRPVVAHVERYPALCDRKNILSLVDSGAYIQVNADSVAGAAGWHTRRFTRRLLRENLVHFVGSDAHDAKRRPPYFESCASWMQKELGTEATERILIGNPKKLLENKYV